MMPRKSKMMLFLLVWLLILGLSWVLLARLMAPPTSILAQSFPDLSIYKYKVSGVFAPGNLVKYEIVFQNASLFPADDIFIRDTLPASTTYVTSSQPGLTLIEAGPDQVRWYKGWLSPCALTMTPRWATGWRTRQSFIVRIPNPITATMSPSTQSLCSHPSRI